MQAMTSETAPVHIGLSPAGIEWICYPHHTQTRAEFLADVFEMRRALTAAWDAHEAGGRTRRRARAA